MVVLFNIVVQKGYNNEKDSSWSKYRSYSNHKAS